MKIYIFAFILFLSLSFSFYPLDPIEKYYKALKEKDIDSAMALLSKEGFTQTEIQTDREILSFFLEKYNIDSYNLEYIYGIMEKDDALVFYFVSAEISGEEELSIGMNRVAYLIKENGQWKIFDDYSLVDYFNISRGVVQISILGKMVDKRVDYLSQKPSEEGITFDGEELEDIEALMENDIMKCMSDEYCQSIEPGTSCIRGFCQRMMEEEKTGEVCPLLFIFLLLPLFIFIHFDSLHLN